MDGFQCHCRDRNRQSVLRLRAVTTYLKGETLPDWLLKSFKVFFVENYCEDSWALMPFVHQDKSREGGGSRENRRSLTNFIGFDALQLSQQAGSSNSTHDSIDGPVPGGLGGAEKPRQWEQWKPASPEAAQSPRSLVPATCFPPGPAGFASYSPGALQLAQDHFLNEGNGLNMQPPWPPEQASTSMINNSPVKPYIPSGGRGSRSEPLRWSGQLPARGVDASGGYSSKVFVGGLPWDITEDDLLYSLRNFQPVRVEWPGREGGCGVGGAGGAGGGAGGGAEASPRGYAYVTFESERRVRSLLAAARCESGNWYYRVSSRNMRNKEVQVIPWAVSDSNYVCGGSVRLEPRRTVFVGALHGMLGAYGLALIMNDLFSGVVYAGIDTDKNKYPIGSGRVTFNNAHSYLRAIAAAYIDITTDKFSKTVQVDPYLEDAMCSVCNLQQGPYFCRDPLCFRYFCRACWAWQHRNVTHKQLMRWSKSSAGTGPRHAPALAHAPHHAPAARVAAPAPASPPAAAQPPALGEQHAYNGYAASCDGTPSPVPSELEVSSGMSTQSLFPAHKLSDANKEPWE
ncbi:Cytoplasmic polyadenylation element-binding protein 1-A [Papilio xuthus]|uniref:Cytoplasmic polyadenylation element-binding protein 1-A n=1 Tax=Papilio xuthus TaxID=66420 RepID=A0A194Q383_PAPXU|nr:Cytoplasmic polyadenylation element-binding protein 1-A [Papilio xuthus]